MSDLPPPTPPDAPAEPALPSSPPPPPPPDESTPASLGSGDLPGSDPQPKDDNEKTLGLLMHLIPLAGVALGAVNIPFGNLLAPLVFWLIKKGESPYLDAMGKEVLNFHINVSALGFVGFLLCFVCIGIPFLIALGITALVLMVMAAIAVSNGKFYRYPWIYRVIK